MIKVGIKMRRLKELKRIYGEQGALTAIKKVFGFLNHHFYSPLVAGMFPKDKDAMLNGVKVPSSEKLPCIKYEDYIPFYKNGGDENVSGGEINAHKKFTKSGDDVVIIGGGRGISAVRASEICQPGNVYVYEASQYYVNLVKRVLALNNVSNCKVIHGAVGPKFDVWDSSSSVGEDISFANLPSHDILEMDCEGAEYEILHSLHEVDEKPKVIIVEIHPHHANKDPNELLEEIHKLGYEIKYRSTNRGKEISKKELNNKLNCLYRNRNKRKGEKPNPPIIGAVQ